MISSKKGVEIPITMIIILIIAIITLGLIIGFIYTYFGSTTDLIQQQLAKVKQTLQRDLEEGRELLVTSFGRKLEVTQGKEQLVAFGLKNSFRNPDGESVCYVMGIKCVKPFDAQGSCSPDGNNVFVGGLDLSDQSASTYVTPDKSWATSIEQGGKIDVFNNAVQTGEIAFQVQADKGSYTTQLVVWKEKNNRDCTNAAEFAAWQTFAFTTLVK